MYTEIGFEFVKHRSQNLPSGNQRWQWQHHDVSPRKKPPLSPAISPAGPVTWAMNARTATKMEKKPFTTPNLCNIMQRLVAKHWKTWLKNLGNSGNSGSQCLFCPVSSHFRCNLRFDTWYTFDSLFSIEMSKKREESTENEEDLWIVVGCHGMWQIHIGTQGIHQMEPWLATRLPTISSHNWAQRLAAVAKVREETLDEEENPIPLRKRFAAVFFQPSTDQV